MAMNNRWNLREIGGEMKDVLSSFDRDRYKIKGARMTQYNTQDN